MVLFLVTGAILLTSYIPGLQLAVSTAVLFVSWMAILLGVIVHAAVGAAKRMRTQSANPAVLPVSKLMVMINARQGEILLKIGMALIGFVVLVYGSNMLGTSSDQIFLLNAFLTGYSLDSVIELFGTSMDQQSAALQTNLKKQLGIEN